MANNNNDGADKGAGAQGKGGASAKPTPLIDLKPTDVGITDPKAAADAQSAKSSATKPSETKPGDAKPASAAFATGSSASGVSASGAAPKGAAPSAPGAKPEAAPASPPGSGSGAKDQPQAASPAKDTKAAPVTVTAERRSSGGGIRSAATHLVAGLAGGLLALLGAEHLEPYIPKSEKPASPERVALQALDSRLAAVEKSTRPLTQDMAQKVAAAEQKLAQLERLSAQVNEAQTKLAAETREIDAKVAAQAGQADAERLQKLEANFAFLTEAAKEQQPGRIPQLAAVTARLADVETSVATQLAQLRRAVTQDVDSRLSQSTEAAQAARAGTQRIDRELAGVKTETAQVAQKADGIKAQADRTDAGLQALRQETAAIKSEVGALAKEVARPKDVASAVSPLVAKVASLEQNVQGVVRGEDDRRANIERIVMALELGNLKRAVERGGGFATELQEVRRVAGNRIDLSALDKVKDKGVASSSELERELKSLAFRVIEADAQPKDATWTDKLLASAKTIVRVRRTDQPADDTSAEAIVSRMEAALKAGRLTEVGTLAQKLSDKARAPAGPWLEKVNARAAVDRAILAVEQQLKSSLGSSSQDGKKG